MKKIGAIIFILLTLFAFSYTAEASTGTKKVAVVLFNFQNDQSQPITSSSAQSMIETVNNFYKENSFNTLNFDTDVFGWYNIPYSNTNCDFFSWATAARAAAGLNLNEYDYFIYAFPRTDACPWSGLSMVGGSQSWNNGRFTLGIVGHELGHSIGMEHANTYRCFDSNNERVAISDTCISYPYGDPFDIMGSGTFSTNYAAHMSVYQKGYMDWFNIPNTLTVDSDGTYTINAMESPSSGIQSLRIPRDIVNGNQRYYYLEYRTAYGFDNYWRFTPPSAAADGVIIRLAPDYNVKSPTQLIDTKPNTLSFEDAPLQVGSTFEDTGKDITIKTLSRTTNTITVQVSLSGEPPQTCLRRDPSISISPSIQTGSPGQVVNYTVSITNNDDQNCGPSTFSVRPTLDPALTQTPTWVSVNNLAPGSSLNFKVKIKASSQGTYQFQQTIANSQSPSYTASAYATYLSL